MTLLTPQKVLVRIKQEAENIPMVQSLVVVAVQITRPLTANSLEVLQEIRMIVVMDSWDITNIPIIGQIVQFDSSGRITLREIGTDAWTQRQVIMLNVYFKCKFKDKIC